MDDRYAALALSYLRGIDNRFVVNSLMTGSRPSDLLAAPAIASLFHEKAGKEFSQELSALESRIHASLEFLNASDIQIICIADDRYPALLTEIPSPPPFLFTLGIAWKISMPQVAIVGSRRASRAGQRQAYDVAGELAHAGFAITSGLALGIDAAAHRGALDAGGSTVAVMGTGLDQIYPARHQKLAQQIADNGGVLLSEFPPGTPPRRENFPRRNRLVSGLCCTVTVVEARARSGSLITARLAAEQGRTVCAFPGGVQDPLKAGCHHLIREGAVLVRSAADIAEAAADILGVQSEQFGNPSSAENGNDHPLLATMGANPRSFEQLLQLSGMSAAELAKEIAELEISGHLYRSMEGYRRTF